MSSPHLRRRAAAAVLVLVALGGCRKAGDRGDRGGAATSDDMDRSPAGADAGGARSNSASQRGRPANDTLPGRDSRPRQTAGHSGPQP
jgi:hypothetical protein